MRAVQYLGNHTVEVRDVPVPEMGPGDVTLKPLVVGVCGTDVHIVEGDFESNPPMTMGHEVCAEVVAIGSEVQKLKVGDLVTVEPHFYCGVCVYCQTGDINMCVRRNAPGVHLDGGMAEFLVLPEQLAFRLPKGVSPQIGALAEPLACAIHGMDRLAPKSGRAAVIFGMGPAGALLTALAKRAGLGPLVVVEMREQRRELALKMGADVTFDPREEGFVEKMMELTDGDGFPYIIDAVGSSKILAQAITLASRKATILIFGVASPDDRLEVSPNEIYAKELSILGTALNPHTHRRAANIVGSLGLEALNMGFFELENIEDALRAQQDGSYDKVFMIPNGPVL